MIQGVDAPFLPENGCCARFSDENGGFNATMKVEVVEVGHGSARYLEALAVRYRVLRQPLGMTYSEAQIAAEADETHLVAIIDASVVGSISIVWTNEPVRLRQMAISPEFQGQGLGALLLAGAEQKVSVRGGKRVELHARVSALGFYQKAGYAIVSEEYFEVGLPHRTMAKALG